MNEENAKNNPLENPVVKGENPSSWEEVSGETDLSYTAPVAPSSEEEMSNVSVPTVVVPGEAGNHKWLYLVFVVTLLIFAVVSILLFNLISGRKENKPSIAPPLPTVTLFVMVTITPTPTPVDVYLEKLKVLRGSDEISLLEADLLETDFSPLEANVSTLDAKLKFSSPKK